MHNKRVAIDIDGTIFVERRENERENTPLIKGAVEAVSSLYDSGYTVILYTARTYRELEMTINQLRSNGIKYHHLVVGKPVADVFIDDRAVVMTNWSDTLRLATAKLNTPQKKVTVLIPSAGSINGVNIIKALQEQSEYTVNTVAVDANRNASGLYMADHYAVVPNTSSQEYLRSIRKICEQHNVEMIIPSHSNELQLYSAHRLLFGKLGIKVLISSRRSIDTCNNKYKIASFFRISSVSYPKTYHQVSDNVSFPVFIKSAFGSGSTYARRIDCQEDLDYYSRRIPAPIIQEFVDGDEYTVNILSDFNGKMVGAVPIRRVRVRNGLSVEAKVVMDTDIVKGCREIVDRLALVGPSNVQVIKRGSELVYIEVNPRFASGTLPLAVGAGFNIPLLIVKIMLGEPIGDISIQDGMVMTRYLNWIIRRGD